MTIPATLLYEEIGRAIGPALKSVGLAPVGRSRSAWARRTGHGYTTVWFQTDKWGWDDQWGSRFTLQFQEAAEASHAMVPGGRFERIGYLLEGTPELDAVRLINNAVIARLPGTLGDKPVARRMPDGTGVVTRGYVANPNPAIYRHDAWMHYFGIDDVRCWGEFLASHIVAFVELFEQNLCTPQRAARQRFDQAVARVQKTSDRAVKREILRSYIGTEPDPHFRAAAENLSGMLEPLVDGC